MQGDSIGSRLVIARGKQSQLDFATQMGVHRNSLSRYESGENEPSAEVLQKIAELGYNVNWLLTGKGIMRASPGVIGGMIRARDRNIEPQGRDIEIAGRHKEQAHMTIAGQAESEFVRIKRYRTKLAAGNGQLGEDTDDVDWLQFRRQYLAFIGLSPKNAVLVRIKGDSMETMLMDGDTVMIDLTDTTIYPPARSFDRRRAYAIKRITGETALVQCKFVELVREDGAEFTQVSSFNDQYAPERVGEGNEIQVIGRIRWHGHTWL